MADLPKEPPAKNVGEKDGKGTKDAKDGQGGKDGKNGKDAKNVKDAKNGKDGKVAKDGKDGKDGKDAKDGKDTKDGKDADQASLGFDQQTVIETPLPPPEPPPDVVLEEGGQEGEGQKEKTKSVIPRDLGVSRHVSTSSNREEIHVILHGATNLPATTQSRAPCAYAIVKTKSNDDIGSTAEVITSFNRNPSFGASWETFGIVTVDERRSTEEVLIFKVVDGPTKQMLAKYHLPVSFLQPFHPYHLEMVVPSVSSSHGIQLIVSITRKLSFIPKNDNASPNYIGLEVLLEGIREELDESVGPITAVAKIASSYYPFREDLVFSHQLDWGHVFGVTPTTVLFPNPPVSLFRPSNPRMAGSAQVTLPTPAEENPPVWNHCFLFINERDSATLFNPHSALLIEFYRTRSGMTDLTWRLTNALGHCVIPLDHDVYRSLAPTATKDTAAVRIEALPLQKCLLMTREKKVPTVSLVLRLITSQRPDSLKTLEGTDDLPVIGNPQQLKDPNMEFPSHDAMEEILEAKRPRKRPDGATSPRDVAPSAEVKRSTDGAELLPSPTNILDFQLNELNAYRDAIRRMERDILGLHDQVRLLQTTNSQLRRQVASRSPTAIKRPAVATPTGREATDDGRLSVEEMDAKLWEKTELEERYELMKTRVARQTKELKEYREKVLRLQNELIKRNEKEKEFLRHSQGSGVGRLSSKESGEEKKKKDALERQLETKTAKIRGLEEACRNQEKIIERMEQLIESKNKGDKDRQTARDKIIEENQRLRLENQMLTEQQRIMSRSQKDEEEVLQLRHKLSRDEERISSLEKQLVENARRWAHDKTDLVTRLEEATNGFQRTSVLDNNGRPVIRTRTLSTDEEDASSPPPPPPPASTTMKDSSASAVRPTKSKAAPTIRTNKRLPNINSSSTVY